jgi:hypothetical protein
VPRLTNRAGAFGCGGAKERGARAQIPPRLVTVEDGGGSPSAETRSCAPEPASVAAFQGILDDAWGQVESGLDPRTFPPAYDTRPLPYSRLQTSRPSQGAPTPESSTLHIAKRSSQNSSLRPVNRPDCYGATSPRQFHDFRPIGLNQPSPWRIMAKPPTRKPERTEPLFRAWQSENTTAKSRGRQIARSASSLKQGEIGGRIGHQTAPGAAPGAYYSRTEE